MTEATLPRRSWLALTSFILSLVALCTIPLPVIPSTLLGIVGLLLGLAALWRIRKKGGANRDRFLAFGGIVLGFLPVISLCITLTFLAHEFPRWVALLSNLFR